MKISYKPLWKLLIDRGVTRKELQSMTGLGSSTFTKLKNNENVTTDSLTKICEFLQCDLKDIAEFDKESEIKNEKI